MTDAELIAELSLPSYAGKTAAGQVASVEGYLVGKWGVTL